MPYIAPVHVFLAMKLRRMTLAFSDSMTKKSPKNRTEMHGAISATSVKISIAKVYGAALDRKPITLDFLSAYMEGIRHYTRSLVGTGGTGGYDVLYDSQRITYGPLKGQVANLVRSKADMLHCAALFNRRCWLGNPMEVAA